jgi:4-hydroxybenzoate polyprenyltransferase
MTSPSVPAPLTGERKNFSGLLRTMRPRQWVKSVIVYAALVFDGKLLDLPLFLQTTVVFFAFCLISSSVYILNDLVDIEKDRQHPRKQTRPLASGRLDARFARWPPRCWGWSA